MAGTFDINQFRSVVAGGFMKPDRYRVRFPLPQALLNANQSVYYNITRYLEFYADSCDLVGVGLSTINIVRYGYGASEQKPVYPNFNNIMMTFYSDLNGDNLIFFQDWMSVINNFNVSTGITSPTGSLYPYEFNYKDDYVVDGMITLLDGFGSEIQTWHPRRMFPLELPNIKLAWALTHDILKLTAIFSYMDWYPKPIDSTSASASPFLEGTNPVQYSGIGGLPEGGDAGSTPPGVQTSTAHVDIGTPVITGGE